MRIGNLEIRLLGEEKAIEVNRPYQSDQRDMSATFAVSINEPWWIAVHLLLDELERETVQGARNQVTNTNMCISAVGAGEGVAMVRQRLIETRDLALQQKPAA